MKSRFALLVGVLVIASMLLTACPAPTPQVVREGRDANRRAEGRGRPDPDR